MSNTCGLCQQATRGDRVLCPTCITNTDDRLVMLYRRRAGAINLLDELHITAIRQSRMTDSLTNRAGAETPLVFNVPASECFTALLRFLRQSARHHRVHHRSDALSLRTVRLDTPWANALWLHRYWPRMVNAPDAVDFAATLRRLVESAVAVIDRPPDEWYAGRCPTCEADLYAVEGAPVVRCEECRTTIDVAIQRERLLAAVDDVLATAAEISRAVHVVGSDLTPSKITNLYHRNKIIRYGRNRNGDHLYRMGDVLAVVRDQQVAQSRARQA